MTGSNYELTGQAIMPSSNIDYGSGESEWGIQSNFENVIIQSEDITFDLVTDQMQDQMGRVVSELDYDKHWTATIQAIGGQDLTSTYAAGGIITYNPKNYGDSTGLSATNNKWKIRSVAVNGAYNDKKKYTFTLEKWANFPK